MTTSFLAVSSVMREGSAFFTALDKGPLFPDPSACYLPGRGCLTQLVTFCIFSPRSLGHHPPLLPALLFATPGLQAAASPLAWLWHQRKTSLPLASGGAFVPWFRGGVWGLRWWPHLPTAAHSASLGSLDTPEPLLPLQDTGYCPPCPGLASDTVYRTQQEAEVGGLGSAGGNWLRPRGPPVHMPPRRTLAAPGGDRVSLRPEPHHTGLWWCFLTLLQTWTSGGACFGTLTMVVYQWLLTASNTPGSPPSLTSQYGRYIIQIAQRYPSC